MPRAALSVFARIRRDLMVDLGGEKAEVRFTVQITRAETGKVEEVEMIGFVDADKLKELTNGSDSLDGGA